MIEGLVLAGGAGRRMGQPKGGLVVDGEPLVRRQADLLAQGGCSPVTVILGCSAERISGLIGPDHRVVVNEDWERGQFSSLVAGLAQMAPSVWVMVLPVDVFPVEVATVRALIGAIPENDTMTAMVPVFNGRRGHPVLLSPGMVSLLLSLEIESARLDRVLSLSRVVTVAVDDPGVIKNENFPSH